MPVVIKTYRFVDPDVTRKEMAKLLIKGLGRALTDQEVRMVYWMGDCDYEFRGVMTDLFKELSQRIEYFKEVD